MLAKLNEKGVFGGSSEIPTGMRVATVPVTVTKTHSGLIMPGDRVDVVVTYSMHKITAGQMNTQMGEIRKAKTILQYIEVFATDNIRVSAVPKGEDKEIAAKNISLLVTPDQYNLLASLRSRDKSHWPCGIAATTRKFRHATTTKPSSSKRPRPAARTRKRTTTSRPRTTSRRKASRSARNSKKKRPRRRCRQREGRGRQGDIWKLRVYEGEKLREEQVELPAEPVEPGKEPAQPREQLKQFLKRFFQSAS